MHQDKAYTRIRTGFIVAAISIAFFVVLTFLNMQHSVSEGVKVKRSLGNLLQYENLLTQIHSVETGQRGYLLTGDSTFLESHESGLKNISDNITILNSTDYYDSSHARLHEQLDRLVEKKIRYARYAISLRNDSGYNVAAAFIKGGEGEQMMNQIRSNISSLEEYDRSVLKEANASSRLASQLTFWLIILLAFIFFGILYFNFRVIIKDFQDKKIAEKKLKYNASLINSLSDPIITTDKDLVITGWNKYAEDIYGWKQEEVIGKKVKDVLQTRYRETDYENSYSNFMQAGIWKGEVMHTRKDGETIHVLATTTALKNEQQQFTGTVAVLRDISDRIKAEGKLKDLTVNLEQEVSAKVTELNEVFDRIADAFIALDNNWNYTYVNKKAAALHGLTSTELIGKNIWELFPDVVHEDFYKALHEARESKEPMRLELFYSKTGQWFEDLIYPSSNGISVYYHDITEKKKIQLELEESERNLRLSNERFELVAKATDYAIWDCDLQKNIITGNERFARIYDVAVDEPVSYDTFIARIHPEDKPQILNNFNNTVTDRKIFLTEEFRLQFSDGKYRTIKDRAYILYDKNGKAYRMLGAMEDITLQKTGEQQLVLEKELSDSIINRLPGIFYLLNGNGRFYRWNRNFEQVTGYTAEELRDLDPICLIPESEREKLKVKIESMYKHGEDSVEAHLATRYGDQILYYFSGMVIRYEGEQCLMGIGIDLTDKKKSQQQLVESEEKFRMLIEQASDGIFISNQVGDYLVVNTSAATLSGYDKEELLQMNMRDVIFEQDLSPATFHIKELITGQAVIGEKLIKKKNGSYINVEISSKMLPDGRFQGIVRDITSRKWAEEGLRYSEEKRRLIMNASLDAIVCIDTNGLVTFWNPQAENIFGWKAEEVYGRKLSSIIIPEKFRDMHDKGISGYLETGHGNVFNKILELSAINRANEEFPVELTVLPIKQGDEEFFCAFIRDITSRKTAEEDTRISEHKYRLLFDQNPMPMWMISLPDRNFLAVNTAAVEFYGYDKDEFLTMNMKDLRPEEEINKQGSVISTYKSGINNTGIWEHIKKDGSIVKMNLITHDIIYQGKHAKLVLANDMTEKIIAEEKLKSSHTELRQLATHLQDIRETERTHMAREIHDELGQQLTGLKMDIAWINRKMDTSDSELKIKMAETLKLIDGTVKTVRRLATQLRPSILDDLGIVAAMEWQSEEFQKRSEIKTNFTSNVANITISPELATGFFRIYQESLTNVSRHAEATQVDAMLSLKDGLLILNITDNGKGFNPKEIESKKTLGLLGMKERTLIMGGSYEITSKPGKGTTVVIVVPIHNKEI